MVRRISSSRPITGSSLPWVARSVRSMLYFSSAWRFSPRPPFPLWGAAAHLLDGLLDRRTRGTVGLKQPAEFTPVIASREHEQLTGNELIAALLRQLVGDVQQLVQVVAEQHLAAGSLHLGHPVERASEIGAQLRYLCARLLQQRAGGAALLVEQRGHEMHRLDVLIVAADGQRLSIGQSRLKFCSQLIHSHRNVPEIAL